MTSRIKCNVSNCDHWKEMRCAAEEVKVNMLNQGSETCTSDTTYCETFKTKEC